MCFTERLLCRPICLEMPPESLTGDVEGEFGSLLQIAEERHD